MKANHLVAGLCAAVLCCTNALAQVPPGLTMIPMPAPDESGAIPLYAGVAPGSEGAQQREQWSEVMGDHVARNVTRPMLTPYLPEKGKSTGAAVIVAPGGGFKVLSMKNEGALVARWLADHGIAAFVLKYRVNPSPADDKAMMEDMAPDDGAPTRPPAGPAARRSAVRAG